MKGGFAYANEDNVFDVLRHVVGQSHSVEGSERLVLDQRVG